MPENHILSTASVSPVRTLNKPTADTPRFTPTELKVLVEDGQLTPEDIAKLHPQDRAIVNKLRMGSIADIPAMGLGMRDLFKGAGSAFKRGFDNARSGRSPKTVGDVMERVTQGGVKVGPMQDMGAAYPRNVNTQSSFDDLLEMITRSSSQGAPSPLMYHESAPKDMRKSVDALKRTVRRKPQ